MKESATRDLIVGRMYLLLTFFSVAALVIIGQLVWIQAVDGPELRTEGMSQVRSQTVLAAERGQILDQANRALVVNTPRYDLALDPSYPGFVEDQSNHIARIAEITGWQQRTITRRIEGRSSPRYVRLGEVSTRARAVLDTVDVPGLMIQESFDRQYNYGTTASHILGHVDRDGVGRAGVELEYDEFLQGTPGRRSLLRDRRGFRRVDAGGVVVDPVDGETVVLTIDLIRQTILEEELARGVREARAQRGSAIAVDPKTGAILAMANVPTFDANDPSATPTHTWRNSAITDRLEPGSSFKLVTATAAIELGLTSMDRIIDTGNGTLNIFGRVMRDVHAQGEIPFRDVITKSSNVGMAKTAQTMEPGELYRYARNFGFGQKTWIDLPGEVQGLLKRTSRWSKTTLTSLSIGYEVDVTPLQMVMAYAALADGGVLRQPYIVAERRDITGKVLWTAREDDPARTDSVRRVMDSETARTLLPAFINVVERGTAQQAQVAGLSVAGKTGTARKVVNGRYGRGYRATFVGFFPADDPQVVMIVVMDEPRSSIYGGAVSAPVFRRVSERWTGTMPNVAARVVPDDMQLSMTPTAPVSQVLTASISSDYEPPKIVPDLIGLSARTAWQVVIRCGGSVKMRGSGIVVDQSPGPGGPCVQGETVLLTLR